MASDHQEDIGLPGTHFLSFLGSPLPWLTAEFPLGNCPGPKGAASLQTVSLLHLGAAYSQRLVDLGTQELSLSAPTWSRLGKLSQSLWDGLSLCGRCVTVQPTLVRPFCHHSGQQSPWRCSEERSPNSSHAELSVSDLLPGEGELSKRAERHVR